MSSTLRKYRRKILQNRNRTDKPPVLIVRPHKRENQVCEQTSEFIRLAQYRGIAELLSYGSMIAEFARNSGINAFLHNELYREYTHIFFLDDDSPPFDLFAIERLKRHKLPVVAGITPIFRYEATLDWELVQEGIVRDKEQFIRMYWSPIIEKKLQNGNVILDNIGPDELPPKLFKAYRTGGTCLLVERRVLEKLQQPYQYSKINPQWTKVELSEDLIFCDNIRAAGFDIWIDPAIECHHYHNLDINDMMQIHLQTMRQMQKQTGATAK